MPSMNLQHQCPQCGAPVELEETDRIFSCPFCQVRLFIHTQGPFQYYLKPRVELPGRLFYVPYWRFRGNGFALEACGLQYRILDSSLLARLELCFPPSLGLRTQALRLFFVEPKTPGIFLPPQLQSTEFKKRLVNAMPGLNAPIGPRLTACVGDTLSLVYMPVFQTEVLRDGITGEKLGPAVLDPETPRTAYPNLHFVSTLCPQCGWDLTGDRQSLVQTCPHCDTAWETGPQGPASRSLRFLDSDVVADRYLPFWNIQCSGTGFTLESWADLLRLTNLPQVVLPWMESTPARFRIPAFKIRPELFLAFSNRLTLYRAPSITKDTLPREPLHPVTLALPEAFQAMAIVLGNLAPAKKKFLPKIRSGKLALRQAYLEYVPFLDAPKEYEQPDMGMAIQKNALHWSKTL